MQCAALHDDAVWFTLCPAALESRVLWRSDQLGRLRVMNHSCRCWKVAIKGMTIRPAYTRHVFTCTNPFHGRGLWNSGHLDEDTGVGRNAISPGDKSQWSFPKEFPDHAIHCFQFLHHMRRTTNKDAATPCLHFLLRHQITRIVIFWNPHKSFLDTPHIHEPIKYVNRPRFVIRPACTTPTKRLLANDGTSAFVIVIDVSCGIAEAVGGVDEGRTICGESIEN